MTDVTLERSTKAKVRDAIVDCDIHPTFRRGLSDLNPYLSKRWQDHLKTYGSLVRQGLGKTSQFPKLTEALARADAWPDDGPPGSNLPLMQQQHLDHLNVEFGMLQLTNPSNAQRNHELCIALASAMNDWQLDCWTGPDKRLKAGLLVPHESVEESAAEIRRRASNKDFAQVIFPPRPLLPPGSKHYWPIFEAAVECGLPLGMHIGGFNGYATTGSGTPSFYYEEHHAIVQTMQSCMMSFILEGALDAFPDLKIVLIEGGLGWIPAMGWRMDKHWARMRDEVPNVKHPPSHYLRRNFWFTTQPIDEPDRPEDLLRLFEWIGWDRILFSTDYPHWDSDHPDFAIKARLTPEQKRMIFAGNAKALYRLG